MAEHLFKNWPVYLGLGGFIWLVTCLIINSRRQDKKEEDQKKSQENK